MKNFGPDKDKALKDVRRVSTALDQPYGMFFRDDIWWGAPAHELLGVDLDKLDQFQIVKPQEEEVPSK